MLSLLLMGDQPSDREAIDKQSAAASVPPNGSSSRPKAVVDNASLVARPVVPVSGAAPAKAASTVPPATDDIDSDWPSEPQASSPSSVGSLAPATDEVDSGWLADGEPEAAPRVPLHSPNFPSDRVLPSELWGASGAESQRATATADAVSGPGPSVAPREEPPEPAVPSPTVPAEPARESKSSAAVVAPRAPARGKAAWVGLALAAAVGVWLARGASDSGEGPGIQALRPEANVERSAPAVAPSEAAPPAVALAAVAPGPEAPEASASPVGVTAPSSDAPTEAPPLPGAASAAPVASAETSGKIVVIVNVRPPQARIYYRGKEAGRAPLRVELEPGQRRAFEVGYPGFMTRRIVVDGSKPDILVGLRAASPYATSSTPPAAEN